MAGAGGGVNFATPQSALAQTAAKNTTTATLGTTALPQVIPSSQANTLTVGNQQTDTTLSPYVAAQLIGFAATNLRPSTQMYVYLNSVDVTSYCCNGYFGSTSNPQYANTIQQQSAFG